MSIRRALVDRGRAVYDVEDPSQPWLEGQPWSEQQLGPWFRCRLTLQEPTEITSVPGIRGLGTRGYRHLEAPATLLLSPTYEDGSSMTDGPVGVGTFIAFQDGQLLQIASQESGDEIWHVHTGVQPIRKLRRVIAFTVGLRRAREPVTVTGPLPDWQREPAPPPPLYGGVRVDAADGEGL